MLYGGGWCRLTGSHGRSRVDRTLIEPSVWSGMPPGPVACSSSKSASVSFCMDILAPFANPNPQRALPPSVWTMRPVFLSHICLPRQPGVTTASSATTCTSNSHYICPQSLHTSSLENIVRNPAQTGTRSRFVE